MFVLLVGIRLLGKKKGIKSFLKLMINNGIMQCYILKNGEMCHVTTWPCTMIGFPTCSPHFSFVYCPAISLNKHTQTLYIVLFDLLYLTVFIFSSDLTVFIYLKTVKIYYILDRNYVLLCVLFM